MRRHLTLTFGDGRAYNGREGETMKRDKFEPADTETATLTKLRNEFDTNYPCQDRLDAAEALAETLETFCTLGETQ